MIVIVVFLISFRFRFQDEGEIKKQAFLAVSTILYQGCQESFWALGQKETCPPPSSNSPNNDTQTKSTTVCHKQGISTTKMN